MIRFKEKVHKNYKICPITAEIFEISTGQIIPQNKNVTYAYVRIDGQEMPVHRIMLNTYLGYSTDDVHHIDGNPKNNCLTNLMYKNRSTHIRDTRIGKKFSEDTKRKISEKNKGKKLSEDTKRKISENSPDRSGEKNPMYGIHRYGEKNPMYGKHHSEESKQKNSEAHLGRKLSEDAKEKCSNASKGRHWWNNGVDLKFVRDCPRRRVG